MEIVHDALCPIIAKRKELYLAAEAKKREEESLLEQAKKNRKRMMLASAIALAIIGLLLFFLWQNDRYLKEQEARSQSENEKDIIQKSLNLSEAEKDYLQKQNDSISYLNRLNELQKDSLKRQKKELNHSLITQQELTQSLQLKNSQLEKQIALINKQQSELEKQLALIKIQQSEIQKKDSIISQYGVCYSCNGIGRSANGSPCNVCNGTGHISSNEVIRGNSVIQLRKIKPKQRQ